MELTYDLTFPEVNSGAGQDAECFEMRHEDGSTRRIRFHDYGEIYEIPGLYERLFYEELKCDSPEQVVGLLEERIEAEGIDPATLSVLDLGAGNGMVGERLDAMGCGELVGVDILPEAADATRRDRPGIYDEYVVGDLTRPAPRELRERRYNGLTTVAALGFGDVPPAAFQTAFDLLDDGGWIAFCIKEDFLREGEGSGFARLIRELLSRGELKILDRRRYRHRFSASGQPLHYEAIVARKRG